MLLESMQVKRVKCGSGYPIGLSFFITITIINRLEIKVMSAVGSSPLDVVALT
jgi:hypothetical protein